MPPAASKASAAAAAHPPPVFRSSAEEAMASLVAAGAVPPHAQAQLMGGMMMPPLTSAVADRADRAMLWKASMRLGQQPADLAASFPAAGGAASHSAVHPGALVEDASEWGTEMVQSIDVKARAAAVRLQSSTPGRESTTTRVFQQKVSNNANEKRNSLFQLERNLGGL